MLAVRRDHAPFPGDHSDKRAARMFLYSHAATAPIQGYAVTLAGTEPESEISLLRGYLKWPANRTWFVDNSKKPEVIDALNRTKELWPGVNVARVNILNLVPELGAIGFANLDFMGAPLHDEAITCLREVTSRMLPRGVIGFTWIRGRENFRDRSSQRLWKLGRGEGDDRRWSGFLRAVKQETRGALDFIGKWQYLSNRSPMSVAVFRKD